MEEQKKRLYRSRSNKVLAGICGGLAEYLNVDPTIIRVTWVLLTLLGGSGVILYIIAYFLMPENPDQSIVGSNGNHQNYTAGMIMGMILICIGGILLLDNLDILSLHHLWHRSWEFLLPAILVLAGIALLMKKEHIPTSPTSSSLQSDDMPKQDSSQQMNNAQTTGGHKQLRRSRYNKKILGVCGGFGEYFDIDPTIVRLVYLIFTLATGGAGIVLYFLMFLIIPESQLSQPVSK